MKHRFFNLNFGRKDFYIFCMALEIYVVEGKCYGISSLILVINSWKSAFFFVLSLFCSSSLSSARPSCLLSKIVSVYPRLASGSLALHQ